MMYEFNHKKTDSFDDYLRRHLEWGHAMFGTPADGRGPLGPLDHLKKEIKEIEESPNDLEEWIDAIILSIDGFLRAGGKVTMVLPLLFAKQAKNGLRDWPDWRKVDPNKAIEHVRTPEEQELKEEDDNSIRFTTKEFKELVSKAPRTRPRFRKLAERKSTEEE
jgi:Protein of unknown function (DUF550)